MPVHPRGSSGSAYVEFLIALMPVFTFFWGMVQLNGLFLADLLTQHAAVTAVRAAVVCQTDSPKSGRSIDGRQCADEAVKEILGMSGGSHKTVASIESADVSIEGASRVGTDLVTAKVRVTYRCEVPLGGMVCGLVDGHLGTATIVRTASFPNQGAYYEYSP